MLETTVQEKKPWRALLSIILYTIIGLFIFQIIGVVITMLFTGNDFITVINRLANPSPNFKYYLVFIQGMTALGAFVLAPLFFIWKHEGKLFSHYFHSKKINYYPAMLTFMMMMAFMMVNSIFIEWNMNFDFPDFMSGFEQWAREKEDAMEQMTQFIIVFDSFGYFLFAFIVVAILAAFGEELLFRGLIQNQMFRLTRNVHVAIWLSAMFFSAFHMQFFGFVPRLLLGAFFGYLYVYSGNLFYPILAHFINNGFTLIMVYLYQNEVSNFDIEKTESLPNITLAIAFIVGSLLFYLFYKQFNLESNSLDE